MQGQLQDKVAHGGQQGWGEDIETAPELNEEILPLVLNQKSAVYREGSFLSGTLSKVVCFKASIGLYDWNSLLSWFYECLKKNKDLK